MSMAIMFRYRHQKLVPNHIAQVKTKEKDGYNAYQLAYYEKREKLVPQPMVGHLKKRRSLPFLLSSQNLR